MKRLLGLTALTGLVTMAMAFAAIEKVFDTNYKIEKNSNLGKAACGVCHMNVKGGKLNPYGKDLEALLKAEKTTKMTPAILAKAEQLDSDKDGVKNIDEIKKDTNPGVATN
ncbi:MAG: hypothetical protein ACOYON_00255 [Fimbriimonas sp.]